jgi:hypothetical protein
VSPFSFACDLFCTLSRGLVFISNANPACSCVYICKFQFRPIHPPPLGDYHHPSLKPLTCGTPTSGPPVTTRPHRLGSLARGRGNLGNSLTWVCGLDRGIRIMRPRLSTSCCEETVPSHKIYPSSAKLGGLRSEVESRGHHRQCFAGSQWTSVGHPGIVWGSLGHMEQPGSQEFLIGDPSPPRAAPLQGWNTSRRH